MDLPRAVVDECLQTPLVASLRPHKPGRHTLTDAQRHLPVMEPYFGVVGLVVGDPDALPSRQFGINSRGVDEAAIRSDVPATA